MSRAWPLTTLVCAVLLRAHAQTVDHPLHIGPGVKTPVLVESPNPVLPNFDHRAHPVDCGQFYIVVDTTGGVYEAKLRKSSGFEEVDAAYLNAILRSRYRPATLDGQPVAVDLYMDFCIDLF